jgi:hypothetical protein
MLANVSNLMQLSSVSAVFCNDLHGQAQTSSVRPRTCKTYTNTASAGWYSTPGFTSSIPSHARHNFCTSHAPMRARFALYHSGAAVQAQLTTLYPSACGTRSLRKQHTTCMTAPPS